MMQGRRRLWQTEIYFTAKRKDVGQTVLICNAMAVDTGFIARQKARNLRIDGHAMANTYHLSYRIVTITQL